MNVVVKNENKIKVNVFIFSSSQKINMNYAIKTMNDQFTRKFAIKF
jgi:hypothetical protein